jgi:hypothetical protein
MKRKHFGINTKPLLVLAAIVSASTIAMSSLITIAAFITYSHDAFSVGYKTDAMVPNYFSAGKGTSDDPYQISTPDNLRSLQRLNALGVFQKEKVYFVLANDITWSGLPLLPIGSDDQPFFGDFDGRGYTITSLVVSGMQTWDVGMFGYVDNSAIIHNFFLKSPSIILGANNDGQTADTTNPLDTYLRNAAQNMAIPAAPTENVATPNSLSWTSTSTNSTLVGLDTTVNAAIAGDNVTFNIEWTSSNPDLLNNSSGSWMTYATPDTTDDTQLTQVFLTGRVFTKINDHVVAYTLERYEINVLGSGVITTDSVGMATGTGNTTIQVIRGIFKTIWPLDAQGNTSNYHAIYCGFFVGHLDGKAQYLGLDGGNVYSTSENGKIVVSGRLAKSSTSLIGRSRGDDVRDGTGSNQYGHTFDFTKQANWTQFIAPGTRTEDDIVHGRAGNFSSTQDFTTQMNLMRSLTSLYGANTSSDPYKYMRIYPTASHGTTSYYYTDENGNTALASGVRALTFSQGLAGQSYTAQETQNYTWPTVNVNGDKDENDKDILDTKDITPNSPKESRLPDYLEKNWEGRDDYDGTNTGYYSSSYDPYGGYTDHYRYRTNYYYAYYDYYYPYLDVRPNSYRYGKGRDASGFTYADFDTSRYRQNMNLVRKYCVSNGFWVYTKGDSSDAFDTIVGTDSYTLNFRIVYTATADVGYETANSWQVLYNAFNYQVARFQPCHRQPGVYVGFIYQDSYLQNCEWYDLHNPKTGSRETTIPYGSANYRNGTIGAMTYTSDAAGSQYDPTLDANIIHADGALHETNVTITVNRKSSFWSAYFDHWFSNDTWYPCFAIGPGATNTLTQWNDGIKEGETGYPNYQIWNGPFQQRSYQEWSATGTKSQRGPDDGQNHYYNSKFALNGNLQVNVLSFQSIFTNAFGNVSDVVKNVDFIYDKTGCVWNSTSKKFTSWNKASNVRVGFNVATAIATGNATYYFYRERGTGTDGSNSIVHAAYTNTTYPATNDEKYSLATLEVAPSA